MEPAPQADCWVALEDLLQVVFVQPAPWVALDLNQGVQVQVGIQDNHLVKASNKPAQHLPEDSSWLAALLGIRQQAWEDTVEETPLEVFWVSLEVRAVVVSLVVFRAEEANRFQADPVQEEIEER